MNTRERLLVSAAELIDENGVHEVGLDVILREAGISKTTFYKYYASKDDLAVAAVEYRAQTTLEKIHANLKLSGGLSLEDDLANFFGSWDCALFNSAMEGCIFLKVCSEYPNPNHAMHKAGRTFPLAMEKLLHDLLLSYEVVNPKLATDKLMMILQGYASYKFVNKHTDLRPVAEFMIRQAALMLGTKEQWNKAANTIKALR